MATKYIEKFQSTSQLAAFAPVTGSAAGIGVVSGQLYVYDGTNFVPAGKSAIVSLTAGATLTPEAHSNRTVVFNAAAGGAIVLPAATATGNKYRIVVGTALSSGDLTVTVPAGSIMKGVAHVNDIGDSAAATDDSFAAGASDERLTFTQAIGGGKVGDFIELEDIATGVYAVLAELQGVTDPTTPFSSV